MPFAIGYLPSVIGYLGRGCAALGSSVVLCYTLAVASSLSAAGATLPAEWQHDQPFEVPETGLVRFSLPLATLDASRPALEDLRLYDDAGNEVPFLLERPAPIGKATQPARSFQVSLNPTTTVITLETGLTQPLDGVSLETPAGVFIKAVQVEGSADGKQWQTLSRGQPIFRQAAGASQLRLTFPPGEWPWLRLTIDDHRSQPIPFTGARVHAAAAVPVPTEPFPITIISRHENPGETRLTLSLGAANVDVAELRLETTEPLFTRVVTLAVPQISDDTIREQTLAQGVIYRVALEGQPASDKLGIPVETRIHSREAVLLIKNQDSPPLPITAVRAERRPVYLVFLARSAGVHHLLTGNSRCSSPNYDLAALRAKLGGVPLSPLKLPAVAANPSYRPPEVLPGIQEGASALDTSAWRFRNAVQVNGPGVQQLELDLGVLVHAQPGLDDLRLLRGTNQRPYILERTSIQHSLTPVVTWAADKKDARLTRWVIKLPHLGLPITRLSCTAVTPLFQRDMTLYEEITDERGETFRRTLTTASWVQTPDRTSKEFTLALDGVPRSETLFLETHNGDNPPLALEKFQAFYPVTRLLFKAQPGDELFLYYGNPSAASPRYDLSLVAGQLLAAERANARLAAEERLRTSWNDTHKPGKAGVVFWGILALVVVVLLVIISRLLPKPPKPGN